MFSTASHENSTVLIIFPPGKGGFVQNVERAVSNLSTFRDATLLIHKVFSRGTGGCVKMDSFLWDCLRADACGDKKKKSLDESQVVRKIQLFRGTKLCWVLILGAGQV